MVITGNPQNETDIMAIKSKCTGSDFMEVVFPEVKGFIKELVGRFL